MQVDIMLLLMNVIAQTEFQDRLHELKLIAEKLQAIIDAADTVQGAVSAVGYFDATISMSEIRDLRAALADILECKVS